jgi:hypothetical protein
MTGRWAHSTEVRHAARNSNDNQHMGLTEPISDVAAWPLAADHDSPGRCGQIQ